MRNRGDAEAPLEAQEEDVNMPINTGEIKQTVEDARVLARRATATITERNTRIQTLEQQLGEKDARIAELEQQLEEQEREVAQLTESVQALSADSEELEQAIGGDGDGDGDGGAPSPPLEAT